MELEGRVSIEFMGTPNPSMTDDDIEDVKHDVVLNSGCALVRDTKAEIGLCYRPENARTAEELTVSLSSNEVYVGFHVGTRAQRDRILACISSALQKRGISCHLEEQ
jgi:hypothetical protein